MTTSTLSTVLAAILAFVLGWSVLLRDRSRRTHLMFGLWCFNLSLLYLFQFLSATLGTDAPRWFGLLAAAFVPLNTERFFRSFLCDDPRRPPPPSTAIVIGTVGGAAVLLGSLVYPIHHTRLFLLLFWGVVFAGLGHSVQLIYQRQRTIDRPAEATKLRYLMYGGAGSLVFSVTELLPGVGIPFPSLGNAFTLIYLYFISQTLIHYRLLDIKELVAKITTLSALVLLLSLIYGLLVSWVGRDSSGLLSVNTLVASITVLLLFDPLRGWVEHRVSRWLFAEKYAFARRLEQLISDLANIISVPALVVHILGELERSGRVTNASLYLANPTGNAFRRAGHVGATPPAELDARTRALFFELLRSAGLLTIDGLAHAEEEGGSDAEDAGAGTRNALRCMEELRADVSLPLIADGRLLGLVNLQDARLRDAYGSDELELFRQVAAQTAVTLRNSQLYEQMKERDRLAALGQMAAGLAHEIRNPLGAIKGAAQLLGGAPPKGERAGAGAARGESESDDMVGIIVEEVDRLDHVVSQFLGYARPDRGARQELNVNEIVHSTVQLLQSRVEGERVETQLASELPTVRADPDQLRQVFLNLALNAFDSLGERGQLRISTRSRSDTGSGGAPLVEIAFRDDGPGIPPELLSDLFIPFFTTKERGTGLGLPISQRIVQSHGGNIEVQSTRGAGACFTVVLPVR